MYISKAGGHSSDSHHVTNCVHDHGKSQSKGGMAKAQSFAADSYQTTRPLESQIKEPESLLARMKTLLGRGKSLLGKIWGESAQEGRDAAKAPQSSGQGGKDVLAVPAQDLTIREASGRVHEGVNPYFIVPEEKSAPAGVLKRIRRRVTRIFRGDLPGLFAGADPSASGKHRRRKEDLRRQSKYRKDDGEVSCILTDDSYLMDSYDKKGKYSKLTTGR